jgi:replicative superfamily II helicase
MAMGNIDSFRWGIVNRYEKEQMGTYESKVQSLFGANSFTPSAVKMGFAYFNMLKGRRNQPAFQALQGALTVDLDRTMQVLHAIDTMSTRWERKDWLKTFGMRMRYGVGPELVGLCQIPNVGQVRAKRLVSSKIRKLEDFLSFDAKTLSKTMKCSVKLAEESLEAARLIELKESLE